MSQVSARQSADSHPGLDFDKSRSQSKDRKHDDADFARVTTAYSEPAITDTVVYGRSGIRGMLTNKYVVMCAVFASMGGLLFGYDQGVISVILTLDVFQERFKHLNPEYYSNYSFYKGLMTAMIELGAVVGAANQGWVADKYSRKYSIMIAVVWFIIG